MNSRDTAKLVTHIYSFYPNFSITPETLAAWESAFSREEYSDLSQAAIACCREPGRVFPPSPGEINEMLIKLKVGVEWTQEEAWRVALRIARECQNDPTKKREAVHRFKLKTQPSFIRTLKAFYPRLVQATRPYNARSGAMEQKELDYLRRDFTLDYQHQTKGIKSEIAAGRQVSLGLEERVLLQKITSATPKLALQH